MTITTPTAPITHRYDFVYLFECKDGNPNGDPDMANSPRFDPETFQGLVSDVCLKRKIRDYVFMAKTMSGSVEPGYEIYILQGHSLESRQRMPYDNLKELEGKAQKAKTRREDIDRARQWMCRHFFDIRAFGAVMSTTDFNCGQVRGPVQLTFARSIDRVMSTEHAITRVAYTTEQKTQATSAQTEMGNKHTIAYGLYAAYGFVNPFLARNTGFHENDLALLWQALKNMFDLDRSASRGLMTSRGIYVFQHDSMLGNAPAHELFDRIRILKKEEVESPRAFEDYQVFVNTEKLPSGVTLLEP